jgi:hypothetical protein
MPVRIPICIPSNYICICMYLACGSFLFIYYVSFTVLHPEDTKYICGLHNKGDRTGLASCLKEILRLRRHPPQKLNEFAGLQCIQSPARKCIASSSQAPLRRGVVGTTPSGNSQLRQLCKEPREKVRACPFLESRGTYVLIYVLVSARVIWKFPKGTSTQKDEETHDLISLTERGHQKKKKGGRPLSLTKRKNKWTTRKRETRTLYVYTSRQPILITIDLRPPPPPPDPLAKVASCSCSMILQTIKNPKHQMPLIQFMPSRKETKSKTVEILHDPRQPPKVSKQKL